MVEKAAAAGLEFDLKALPNFEPNPLADGHDSFSALYKLLGLFRVKPKGEFRTYDAKTKETRQALHPGVTQQFKQEPEKKKWPPTFFSALEQE